MTSIKSLVEWSEEGSPSRSRNLILYSAVALYFGVTILLILVAFFLTVPSVVINIYYSISAIFVSVVGFYTTTHPKTSEDLSQENQLKNNENQLEYFKGVFDKVLSNGK